MVQHTFTTSHSSLFAFACSNTVGALPVISVDLHGCYVDEALRMVESGLRNLPEVTMAARLSCSHATNC